MFTVILTFFLMVSVLMPCDVTIQFPCAPAASVSVALVSDILAEIVLKIVLSAKLSVFIKHSNKML